MVLCLGLAATSYAGAAEQPNIVIFLADDHGRAERLGLRELRSSDTDDGVFGETWAGIRQCLCRIARLRAEPIGHA